MQETIKVHVVKYGASKNLVMRYLDPTTGRQVTRTAGTPNRQKAERAAAKWESELCEGRYQKPSRLTWDDFREKFAQDYLDGVKEGTAQAYEATLNVFGRKCNPGKLAEVTTSRLTAFVTMLRDDGRTPATIARHLRTLKLAMRWAHKQGLLNKLPEFAMPKHAKGMKGRPITGEEFDRLTAAAPELDFYLQGLWTSGLRLTESLGLRWDDAPGALVVDYSGRHPMLRIPAESEKGNTHRTLPMAPEFAQLLATVPESDRRGFVFHPVNKQGALLPRSRHVVGPRVAAVGKAAGVVVNQKLGVGDDGEPITVNTFASAHDLRRSFGFRWSRRVMPTVLRELMRHESIETTMRYYVGLNAQATADELWRVAGSFSGSMPVVATDSATVESTQVVS